MKAWLTRKNTKYIQWLSHDIMNEILYCQILSIVKVLSNSMKAM